MKMKKVFFPLALSLSSQTIFANEPILPSMINLPAGSFMMGSESGDDVAKPMHQVTLPEFQMGKYQVTVAEYRRFVEDTNYQASQNCNDIISETWLASPAYQKGTATWDNHRYSFSEYQPAVCLSRKDIYAYISWLNKKTDSNYRLPTEQEWEYAIKANTTSRFFWGEDPNLTQACLYGNIADHSDEYISSKKYGASYVGFLGHANCDDGEAFTTIVGLYRPNPFGLYDMIGNASHYLSSCYTSSYEKNLNEEMDIDSCKMTAHRGSSWHNKPSPHASRGVDLQFDWTPSTLKGFRLVQDGNHSSQAISTINFEKRLKVAQKERLDTRPILPSAPEHVFLAKDSLNKSKNAFLLSWEPSQDKRVIGYDIYKSNSPHSHNMGKFYKKHYHKIKTVMKLKNYVKVELPDEGGSFRVVALTKELSSLPSPAAVNVAMETVSIPGRVNMNKAIELEDVLLNYRAPKDDKPELYYLSKPTPGWSQPLITSTFKINVQKTGWYQLNYNGFTRKTGTFFKLWLNNKLIGEIDYDPKIKDTTSTRHRVYLEKGEHELQLGIKRKGRDFWSLGWLDLSELPSDVAKN